MTEYTFFINGDSKNRFFNKYASGLDLSLTD